MAEETKTDQFKEKYRPQDPTLDREVDDALAGLSIDDLYATASGGATAARAVGHVPQKGMRWGKVTRVDEARGELFVDFGGKAVGVASLLQFDEVPAAGQELEFHVERFDPAENLLILTKKGATATNVSWDNLEIGQVIEGGVTGMNKGGLELDIKGMRAFMPAGQVDLFFQKDISTFIGQRLKVEVTQFDRNAKNLVVSRRNILEREKEEAKQKAIAELEEGQTRRGTVRSVMDYGAFVDLGGVDGLLHVSEMSWRRGRQPSEFVKVGDIVDVKIIKFDRETGKLSLSLKQAMADPWVGAENKYAVGAQVTGRVARVESFGAFIEIEEGVEGLLPVSEMSWQRIRHPSDVVKEGDTIGVVVIAMDAASKKLTFSLKQAGPDPWKNVKDRYATDMLVGGTVTRVVDFGAFVELETGLEGLVHISELATQRVRAAGDVVKPGQAVQVRILEIDPEARRISLSIRRATETAAPASAPAATPSTPAVKKKRPALRGGLEF